MKKRFVTALVAAHVGALAIPVVAQIQAGPELRVNTYTTTQQQEPKLAMDAQGNFVIVWQSSAGQDGSGHGIFGQRFGADGSPVGGAFQVNTTTAANQHVPSVALLGGAPRDVLRIPSTRTRLIELGPPLR